MAEIPDGVYALLATEQPRIFEISHGEHKGRTVELPAKFTDLGSALVRISTRKTDAGEFRFVDLKTHEDKHGPITHS